MSSGDFIADRRFQYAAAYAARGDHQAARDVLELTVERSPDWLPAWVALGDAEAALGQVDQAHAVYRQALALAPQDPLGVSLKLARLGTAKPPARAPDAYVSQLFDDYAGRFESHLVGCLGYRGPKMLAESVDQLSRSQFSHVIDLGCGTGLCGAVFRPMAARLTGVDLSAQMIGKARAKRIYDRLAVQDIASFLVEEADASANLVLAADVLIYIGDLTPLFCAVYRVLSPKGLFAFTLQKTSEDFALGADLRFAHSPDYIRNLVKSTGFAMHELSDAVIRRDAGRDVPGLIVILEK